MRTWTSRWRCLASSVAPVEAFGRNPSSAFPASTNRSADDWRTHDQSLPKARRKELQVEHAPHLSEGAALVTLADKIANLTDILESPPPWTVERKAACFAWATRVVDGLPTQHASLRARFDALLARSPAATAA